MQFPALLTAGDRNVRKELLKTLITPHLRIEPLTARLGLIAREGPQALAQALDADIPPEWHAGGGLRLLARAWRHDGDAPAERALVVHRGDERVIGDLRFEPVERMQHTLELGYAITPLYRRQGFATEAAGRLLDWALDEGGARQVIAGCHRRNRPSVRTLRRLGFWLDGARGEDFWWAITPDLRQDARDG
jgi:[ribosomal protein S5]-alanine N-acetyltransferase